MSLNALVETICYTSKSYKMLEAYHFLFLYSYCLYWKCYFIRYKLLQFNVEPLFTLKNDKKWIFVFSQTHEFTYANLIWQTQKSISLNTNVLVRLCIYTKRWQYLLDIFKRSTKTNHVTHRTHIENAVVYIVVEDWQRPIVCLCGAWLTIINF